MGERNRKPIVINVDDEDSWIVINADENKFKAYGSPQKLTTILKYLQEWLT